jgi:hypothetical protein
MTAERLLFVLWLASTEEMEKASGLNHQYYLGKTVAYVEAYSLLKGIMFVEASRELMNMRQVRESAGA